MRHVGIDCHIANCAKCNGQAAGVPPQKGLTVHGHVATNFVSCLESGGASLRLVYAGLR